MNVAALQRLDTERDDTFVVTGADGTRRVLKVAHPEDDVALLEMQCSAILWAAKADPSLPLPMTIRDVEAAALRPVVGDGGEPRVARMMQFLHGATLRYPASASTQRIAVGVTVARLSAALSGFDHPSSARYVLWDLKHLEDLTAKLSYVREKSVRAVVERLLDSHRTDVGARLRATRRQVVHQDLNPSNLLVDATAPQFVTGILDFGDLVHSSVVGDLAVAAAYAVDATVSSDDPWAGAYDVGHGFTSVRALTVGEVAIFPDLVLARLGQRLVLQSWLTTVDPINAHYTGRALRNAAEALSRLTSVARPPDERLSAGEC